MQIHTRVWNYNEMDEGNGDGDGDDAGDDEDRCPSLQDLSGGGDGCPSASSPSRSLPEVRFRCFLGAMDVWLLIRSHGVKVFDETDPWNTGTAGGTVGVDRTIGR